ncbi:polar amino acid transport system substrate-binding protein [Bradyrhizobium japonicum]
MLIKFCIVVGVFAVAANPSAGIAFAEGSKKVINAATITTYPPFSFKDPATNKLTGFDIDTFEAIAAKMGARVSWTETSFDQLISFSGLKTHRVDVNGSGMGDTAERRASVNFLDYVYEGQVFYTLGSNVNNFPNVEAVCGKRVAITRSSIVMNDAVKTWSDENCTKAGKPEVVIMPSENSQQSQQMLTQGRVDASVSGAGVLAYENSLHSGLYLILGKPLTQVMYGMGFRKEDTQFGEELKKAFGELIADGTYAELMLKWSLMEEAAIQKPMINGER